MNPKVDQYLIDGCMRCSLGATPDCKVNSWQKELLLLREIVLTCGLTEEVKWGVPCYTFDRRNILLIIALKDYCCISFFKGALLRDTNQILVKQGKNVQAGRILKFTSLDEILKIQEIIPEYIMEAVEVEKAGLQVEMKQTSDYESPDELVQKFKEDPAFAKAFEALTPGRQRGYLLHFSQAKQSKTRFRRIEKFMPKIFAGKGWNEYER